MRFVDLFDAIRAVCPLDGLDGNPADRTTWVLRVSDRASGTQRSAAQVDAAYAAVALPS